MGGDRRPRAPRGRDARPCDGSSRRPRSPSGSTWARSPPPRSASTPTRALRAVLSRTTWHPWSEPVPPGGPLTLDVSWPKDRLTPERAALARATVRNTGEAEASVVTLEIGIPPGCTVRPEDVRGEGAERVELGETEVVIYLRSLAPGARRTFEIPFTPRYRLDVQTAPTQGLRVLRPRGDRPGAAATHPRRPPPGHDGRWRGLTASARVAHSPRGRRAAKRATTPSCSRRTSSKRRDSSLRSRTSESPSLPKMPSRL